MRCTNCGCPGAYPLFNGVVCWSRLCRNFQQCVVSDSEFSADGKLVNGDSLEELHLFLNPDDSEEGSV